MDTTRTPLPGPPAGLFLILCSPTLYQDTLFDTLWSTEQISFASF